MIIEFQNEVLKFLLQDKLGKKYITMIDTSFFDLHEQQLVYDTLVDYTKKYKRQPSLVDMLQFFDTATKAIEIQKDVYNKLVDTIKLGYKTITSNSTLLVENIIRYHQQQLTISVFKKYGAEIEDGDAELFKQIHREIARINALSLQDEDEESNKGEFLLKDYRISDYSLTEGSATYIHALNKFTSTNGFYSPQLIIIMGAPKSFKTGTLLNIGVKYARDGLKVYYADCENGQDRIRDRARQCMLECSFSDLSSGSLDETLTEMVGRYKALGGDMKFDFYPAHTKTIADVELELEYLKEEFGWVPDLICYDYLDLMKPIDSSIKEKRLQIQAVYFDAIRLQKKWGVFGITLSQVNREAVNKAVITMEHFAEDFGKAANCHAAFALCGTPHERAGGYIRLVPVAQRDGVAYNGTNSCLLLVDEGRMSLKEANEDEMEAYVEYVENEGRRDNPKKRVRRVGKHKDVTDD